MTMHFQEAPLSGFELLLIRKSEPLKGTSITFSKQGGFQADIWNRQACPFTPGAPAYPRPANGGMGADKPAAGLRKHQSPAAEAPVPGRRNGTLIWGLSGNGSRAARTRECS